MTPEGHSLRSPVFAGDLGHTRSSTFFNGEVVQLDGPLPDLDIQSNNSGQAA